MPLGWRLRADLWLRPALWCCLLAVVALPLIVMVAVAQGRRVGETSRRCQGRCSQTTEISTSGWS